MSVSTHVLDASLGVPAAGIPVELSRRGPGEAAGDGNWALVESGVTDADGRHRFGAPVPAGTYRLVFATAAYFTARAVAAFYPQVTITFTVPEHGAAGHFHVPLLLSPFAYSTYRGS